VKLAPNFTLDELQASNIANRRNIDNRAPWWALPNLRALANGILQPVRDEFKRPVIVTSGFRCQELERVLKRKPSDWFSASQHALGEAADFHVPGVSNGEVARWIEANLYFDQLILEFHNPKDPQSGWVHCSYVRSVRQESLTALCDADSGQTVYHAGLLRPLPTLEVT
jgi:hypothetical protein